MTNFIKEQYKDCGRHCGGFCSVITERRYIEDYGYGYMSAPFLCELYPRTGRVLIMGIGKNNKGRYGEARCNPFDTFDPIKGVAIAWARYKGIEIPKEVLEG